MSRRVAIALAAAALCGCAGAPQVEPPTVRVTKSFYVELWVMGEENLSALYQANELGQIGFGGGTAARNHVITWAGTMEATGLEQLRALVQEHGWCTGKVASVPEPRQRVNRIQVQCQGKYRRMTVRGASPAVEPLRLFLDRVARMRLLADEQELVPMPTEPGAP